MKHTTRVMLPFVLLALGFQMPPSHAEGLKDLLFFTREWKEFRITGSPESYLPDDLWEYLNGAAPGYVAYGLEEMVAFRMGTLDGSLEIETNIFDMGSELNAFGIFSAERSPEGRSATYGVDAYQTDSTLFFWQNRYYVKMIAYDPSPRASESLALLAGVLSDALPKNGNRPHFFSAFPLEHRVPNSETYIRRDVLGHEYLHHGYRVNYKKDGHEYRVFLIRGADPETAKQNFIRYRDFLKTAVHIPDDHLGIGEQSFAGTHRYYGSLLCARRERNIVVVLGHDGGDTARDIVVEMFRRLETMDAKSPS